MANQILPDEDSLNDYGSNKPIKIPAEILINRKSDLFNLNIYGIISGDSEDNIIIDTEKKTKFVFTGQDLTDVNLTITAPNANLIFQKNFHLKNSKISAIINDTNFEENIILEDTSLKIITAGNGHIKTASNFGVLDWDNENKIELCSSEIEIGKNSKIFCKTFKITGGFSFGEKAAILPNSKIEVFSYKNLTSLYADITVKINAKNDYDEGTRYFYYKTYNELKNPETPKNTIEQSGPITYLKKVFYNIVKTFGFTP